MRALRQLARSVQKACAQPRPKFGHVCVADEHFLPTLFAVYGMDESRDGMGELTYTDWLSAQGSWHPTTFHPGNAQASIFTMRQRTQFSECAPPCHLAQSRHLTANGVIIAIPLSATFPACDESHVSPYFPPHRPPTLYPPTESFAGPGRQGARRACTSELQRLLCVLPRTRPSPCMRMDATEAQRVVQVPDAPGAVPAERRQPL